ncbi:TPA: hypothetical protein EYN65_02045 [Candidatus Poribacteria bacterium]|nr:hypothetical protein [Candidatus Poribacteria bacterium]
MPEKDQILDSTQYHKKGVSPENAKKLCLGGDAAMEAFWELYIDLQEFVIQCAGGESGLFKINANKSPDGVVVETFATVVMEHAANMARNGTLIKALLAGDEDESPAFIKNPYLSHRCIDYLRRSESTEWQKKSSIEVENQQDPDEEDEESPVLAIADPFASPLEISQPSSPSNSHDVVFRDKFPFPFHTGDRLTRGHDLFVLQQFPKIEFCGGEKESESLDRISDWTGIPADQLRHRLSQTHSDATLRRDNQLQQLKSIDERKEIPSQKSRDRIDRITRIQKDGYTEPLKKEDLQVLFEEPLNSADVDQNLKRYRDLCENIGLANLLISKEQSELT